MVLTASLIKPKGEIGASRRKAMLLFFFPLEVEPPMPLLYDHNSHLKTNG